ncbi:MAG: SDR family oxidoreductase [Candidatus Omnitrophica bacterium]|nr:SDR family oxidoreductase [Candidatus Omnitrophota bacterium]
MSKYLVTGGAGFIGSSIVEELVKLGQDVVVLDNLSEGKIENIEPFLKKITFIEGDIRSDKDLRKAFVGIDYVLHQAALRSVPKSMTMPLEYNDVNVTGTLNVLKNAADRKVKKFVFASSSSVYGDTEKFPEMETDLPDPISPYAASKLLGEWYCKLFSNIFGLETVSLRYFNVFGPRQSLENQYAVLIPKFATCILNNENPPIFGNGKQERDFTFIQNVVNANIKAATTTGIKGEIFNVACGHSITVLDVVAGINKILGKSIEPVFLPKREGDVFKTDADITKLKERLGLNDFVSFEKGLEITVNWFKERQ